MKRLFESSKHFREDLDLSELDPSHEHFSKENKKKLGKIKLATAPEVDLDEAVPLWGESYSINIKQYSSHCIQRGVRGHIEITLEDNKNCLEIIEIKYGVNYFLRGIKLEISKV